MNNYCNISIDREVLIANGNELLEKTGRDYATLNEILDFIYDKYNPIFKEVTGRSMRISRPSFSVGNNYAVISESFAQKCGITLSDNVSPDYLKAY